MIKYLFLFLISFKAYPGQSYISASVGRDNQDSQTNTITASHQFKEVYSLSMTGSRNKILEEDVDTIESTAGSLAFSHLVTDYYNYQFYLGSGVDSEYISNTENGMTLSFYLNRLWDSLYQTTLDIGYARTRHKYYREFTNRTADIEILEVQGIVGITQEITSSWSVSLTTTNYNYPNDDPIEIADNLQLILVFVPQFESLLYDFYQRSNALGLNYEGDKYFGSLFFQKSITLINEDEESMRGASLGRFFGNFDMEISHVQVVFLDSTNKQTTLSFGYFF
jgi:hypothetical protein